MKKYFLLAASALAAILTFSSCNDKPGGPKKEGYVTDAQGRRLVSRITKVEENPFYSTEFPVESWDAHISYDDKLRPLKIEWQISVLTEVSDENGSSRKPKTPWDNSGEYIQKNYKITNVFAWADKSVTITETRPDWGGDGSVTTSVLFHLNENGFVDFYEKDGDDEGMGYRESYTYDAEGYLQTITTEYENGRREQESIPWKNGHVADEFIPNKVNRSNYDFEGLQIGDLPCHFDPASFDLFGKTPSGYRSYDDFFQYNKVPTKYEFDEEGFLKSIICTGNHAEDFPTPQTYKQSYSYLEY